MVPAGMKSIALFANASWGILVQTARQILTSVLELTVSMEPVLME